MDTRICVNEAAKRLNVHPRTVRKYISSGLLPAYKLGPGEKAPVRIDVADLERFMRPSQPVQPARPLGAH
jgi:excisionase family DNA binding protein